MIKVADIARADIALTPERIYYRFATEESIEDGELPAPKQAFDQLAANLITDLTALEGEAPLGGEVKVTLFVNNRLETISMSERSLRRLVDRLRGVAEEFAFLGGFC